MSRGLTVARMVLAWPVLMFFFDCPGNQFREQPVHPVRRLDPGPGQLGAPVDQQPQRLELGVVGQHPQGLGAHHGDRVGVVRVGLAVVACLRHVEHPRPGRELRWDVDHVLTVRE